MGIYLPQIGMKIPKIFELPPPRQILGSHFGSWPRLPVSRQSFSASTMGLWKTWKTSDKERNATGMDSDSFPPQWSKCICTWQFCERALFGMVKLSDFIWKVVCWWPPTSESMGVTLNHLVIKIHSYIYLIWIYIPAPPKGCQMVPKGCQFTIP